MPTQRLLLRSGAVSRWMGTLSKALSFETRARPTRAASQNCLTPTPRADMTPNPVTTIRGVNADLSWLPLDFRYGSGPLAWCRRRTKSDLYDPCTKGNPSDAQKRARPNDGQ